MSQPAAPRARFAPVRADRLPAVLADWVERRGRGRLRIGVDGDEAIGSAGLADAIADELRGRGRPAARVDTRWWWRAAALRLEHGRADVDTLLGGWFDAAALRREVLVPFVEAAPYLTRLRDPEADRSVRERPSVAPHGAVLIVNGPFLQRLSLPFDAIAHLAVSPGTLHRALPADRAWWAEAYASYTRQQRPDASADLVVAYDHPAAPAVTVDQAGPVARKT